MILISLTSPKLWILVSAGMIVLGVLIFLLYHFVVSRNKARKMVSELEREYDYLHALLIGQVAQYIKRLEVISQRNLLYVDIHENYQNRFQTILQSTDKQAQYAISAMEELILQKKFKEFQSSLSQNMRIIELFRGQVKDLNDELTAKLQPEEDCRAASLALKDKFRTICSAYIEKQMQLTSIEDTFTRTFTGIEGQFDEYERMVESANYEDANHLLPTISKMLDELSYALNELPTLCALVEVTVPSKIETLQQEYGEMKEMNIPIHHLKINTAINQMNSDLYDIQISLTNFELKGVKERLASMMQQIDEFHELFLKEKQDKNDFEVNCDLIYERVTQVERQFISLRHKLLKVKEVYQIEDTYVDKMNEIQNEINQLGITKRQLDTFIHASTKQPYSVLLQKMKELEENLKKAEEDIKEYMNYVDSLRSDSDTAFNLVSDAFIQLKQAEAMLRNLEVPNYEKRLVDRFKQAYEYLNNIYNTLMVPPIKVKEVNRLVSAFQTVFQELVSEIKEQSRLVDTIETSMMEANAERLDSPDYDKSLTRAERFFFDGDFIKSHEEINATLKKMRS